MASVPAVEGPSCPALQTYALAMDLAALWRTYGRHAAIELRAGPAPFAAGGDAWFLVFSGAPHVDMNQAALFAGATVSDAQAIAEAATSHAVPCLLAVSASLRNGFPVRDALAGSGFVRAREPEGLYRAAGLPAVRESPFDVRRVRSADDHTAMRRVYDTAHGYADEATLAMGGPALLDGPDVAAYLAWDGDTPIAGVYLTRVEGTLGVFDMNTDPAHRRRGAAAAVLTRALAESSADTGSEEVLLWSTPAGRPLYESLGFTKVDDVEAWTLGASEEDLAAVGTG